MKTEDLPSSISVSPPTATITLDALPTAPAFPWVRVAVVTLAAVLRLWDLDLRPPHFDEGVNGWFIDQMQHLGCYQYDPSNYHGPLHFYVLFLFKTLFGRHLWALRLPVVLVGVLTVDWIFRFERFLGRRTCAWAALGMALSPGMLYYQRDAIHETWLVFFLILGFWGIFGLWQEGNKKYLWALGMGLTGAILTKETYLIHVGCLLLAVPCLLVIEALSPSVRTLFTGSENGADEPPAADPSAPPPMFDEVPPWSSPVWRSFAPQAWRESDAWTVGAVSLALILFFYSGNGFHVEGIRGLFTTFAPWGHKANEGEGHNKPFLYWARLLMNNEPTMLLGMLACFFYAVPPLPKTSAWVRWTGIVLLLAGLGGFAYLTERYPTLQGIPGTEAPDRWNSSRYLLLWVLSIVVFAVGVSCRSLPPPRDWRIRLLAIYGLGNFVAYSLIPYKTPWCAISFGWPFLFVAGAWLTHLADRVPQLASEGRELRSKVLQGRVYVGAAVLMAFSAFLAIRLNYFRPTAETGEDYVYVQTLPDAWKITDPMLRLARKDPRAYEMPGLILCGSTYPLPWMLGDFTSIDYYGDDVKPPEYRKDFVLVADTRVTETESHLDADYFKEKVHLRSAQNPLTLYLRASRFAPVFPGRKPEFHGAKKPPAPPAPPVVRPLARP